MPKPVLDLILTFRCFDISIKKDIFHSIGHFFRALAAVPHNEEYPTVVVVGTGEAAAATSRLRPY